MLSGLLQPTPPIIVLVIALVFLGPKRLPNAGRALGRGPREFKNAIGGSHDDHLVAARTEVAPKEHPR